MTVTQFSFPTDIKFGVGARRLAARVLKEAGFNRPLVITDTGLSQLDIFKELERDLTETNLIPAVFAGISGNPVESQVIAGVTAYHEHGADCLVIMGGGASLDVGKAVALKINHPGVLFDYEDGKEGALPVDQPIPFMLALPTTAGTGSEVGRSAVISDDKSKTKKVIFDPKLLPPVVLADPELTVGLPAKMTAATGFDALTHNVEAYLAKGFHPICDGIAVEGVRLVARHFVRAVECGTDLEARGSMMMASMMGAIAFQKGLGVTHSCAHALSTVYDLHHGLANAMMLPACLRFNQTVARDRLAVLGQAAGLKEADEAVLSRGFIEWVVGLRKKVALPNGLEELGVKDVEAVADVAVSDKCHLLNPRDVSRDDIVQLLKDSL